MAPSNQDGEPSTPLNQALGDSRSPRGRGTSSDRPPAEPASRDAQLPRALMPAKGQPLPIKCVLLGDSGCGKTSLTLAYSGQSLPEVYASDAAPFNVVAKAAGVQGELLNLSLWDTHAGEEMDRLRPLAYQAADLVFLCFSVAQPESYESCRAKWSREIAFHAPDCCTVLVGLMSDLRQDAGTISRLAERELAVIEPAQGENLARALECNGYVECSSLTGDNVAAAVEKAVAMSLPKIKASLAAALEKQQALVRRRAEEAAAAAAGEAGDGDRRPLMDERDRSREVPERGDGFDSRRGNDGRNEEEVDTRGDGGGREPGGGGDSQGSQGDSTTNDDAASNAASTPPPGSDTPTSTGSNFRKFRKSAARVTGLRGLFSGKRSST